MLLLPLHNETFCLIVAKWRSIIYEIFNIVDIKYHSQIVDIGKKLLVEIELYYIFKTNFIFKIGVGSQTECLRNIEK